MYKIKREMLYYNIIKLGDKIINLLFFITITIYHFKNIEVSLKSKIIFVYVLAILHYKLLL